MRAAAPREAIGVTALVAVTCVWAFSFGLIGRFLSGVDPFFVGTVRLGVACACFLPFLRLRGHPVREIAGLASLGAVQFGVMYVSYLSAFRFLEAWQVALFSVLTPVWVAAVDALLRRRWEGRFFLAAILSVAGAAAIQAEGLPRGDLLRGFLLMQLANLAFAGGQVWFREWKRRHPETPEREVFALLYGGALLCAAGAAIAAGTLGPIPDLSGTQWAVLLYLGLVASGLGFFLWNYGASRVSAGFLAAANNLVVPLGVVFALALGRSEPDWIPLAAGTVLVALGLVVGRKPAGRSRG